MRLATSDTCCWSLSFVLGWDMFKKLLTAIAAWWAEFPYQGFSKDQVERDKELSEWQTY